MVTTLGSPTPEDPRSVRGMAFVDLNERVFLGVLQVPPSRKSTPFGFGAVF